MTSSLPTTSASLPLNDLMRLYELGIHNGMPSHISQQIFHPNALVTGYSSSGKETCDWRDIYGLGVKDEGYEMKWEILGAGEQGAMIRADDVRSRIGALFTRFFTVTKDESDEWKILWESYEPKVEAGLQSNEDSGMAE